MSTQWKTGDLGEKFKALLNCYILPAEGGSNMGPRPPLLQFLEHKIKSAFLCTDARSRFALVALDVGVLGAPRLARQTLQYPFIFVVPEARRQLECPGRAPYQL